MSKNTFPPHPRAWLLGGSKEGQLDAPLVRDDGAQRLHPGQPALGEAGADLVGFAIELFDLRADPNCPALTGGSRGDEHRRPLYVLSLSDRKSTRLLQSRPHLVCRLLLEKKKHIIFLVLNRKKKKKKKIKKKQ